MHVNYGKVAILFEVQSGSTFVSQKLHGLAVKKVLCRSHVADVCVVGAELLASKSEPSRLPEFGDEKRVQGNLLQLAPSLKF